MIPFTDFLVEAKDVLRQGIAHPKDLKYEHLAHLIGDGHLRGDVTEKSDGMSFGVGHDENGFYTRTSRSDKMRNPGDYEKAARAKFGDEFDPEISRHFDRIHKEFQSNPKLTDYLQQHHSQNGGDSLLKGEIFYKPHGTTNEKGMRFVGTHYNPKLMGKTGMFVHHSRLPESETHDPEHVKTLGDDKINFDHDIVPNSKLEVPVPELLNKFQTINPAILSSRKKTDAEAKAIEQKKLADVNSGVEATIRKHTNNITPKWGNETEGHVFHPANNAAPLVKTTSQTFQDFKAAKQKPANFKVKQ